MIIRSFQLIVSNFFKMNLQVLVSGDESGKINIWCLTNQCLQILKCIEPNSCGGGNIRGQIFSQSTDCKQEFPVTTLSLWNKVGKGIERIQVLKICY